ncbi:hypothetical protein BJY04DRAFT_178002 [Aspergillus karnatakaensis]|uniref:uncharacterized protein n=1 Tax=Aspergillus karnatakaensis TaxID=1810916 RepID=UPI003CCE2CC8
MVTSSRVRGMMGFGGRSLNLGKASSELPIEKGVLGGRRMCFRLVACRVVVFAPLSIYLVVLVR